MPALLLFLAAIALPPKPDHYVTDRAGVLKNAHALNERLADFERTTSDQILVYVDQHLPPDTTIEEMGSEAMRQWGVGQKGKDNGAILFVFIGDRKMRIEVGYGLEGSLTDAKAKWITSNVIKPYFQRGDYDTGIGNGVDAILAAARNESYLGTGRIVAELATPVGRVAFFGLLWILFLAAIAAHVRVGYEIGLRFAEPMKTPDTKRYVRRYPVATLFRPVAVGFVPTACLVPALIYEEHIFNGFPVVFVWILLPFATVVGLMAAAAMIDNAARRSSGFGGAAGGESYSPSVGSSSAASSSSSSSFEGGGGSGGGGGASDSW